MSGQKGHRPIPPTRYVIEAPAREETYGELRITASAKSPVNYQYCRHTDL